MKLEIGYNHSFEVRKEKYLSNLCKGDFTILYLSDLHLNKFSKNIICEINDTITALNPTIVLLGGDYVDSRKGLIYLNSLLSSLSQRENVFAIAGNHDYSFGIDEIEKTMSENNIIWLENKTYNLNYKNKILKIDGNFIDKAAHNSNFSILFLHKPQNPNKFKNNYNLAFAGHLHGCQFVFWEYKYNLYPGRLFYRWNILKTRLSNCYYFISKGLGDTLPVRFNCKRDMLFIQVISQKSK